MKIIFILASSRSGTTLLNSCLGKHSMIKSFNELHFFNEISTDNQEILNEEEAMNIGSQLIAHIEDDYGTEVTQKHTSLTKQIFNEKNIDFPVSNTDLYTLILHHYTENDQKKIATDQTGKNIHFYNFLTKCFPENKFVFVFRDPRAILYSQKNRGVEGSMTRATLLRKGYIRDLVNYHPFITSWLWLRENKRFLEKFNEIPHYLLYENLIHDPQKNLESLCNYIGVPFEKEMLNIQIIASSFSKAGKETGFVKKNVSRWENELSKTEIWLNQKMTFKYAKKIGYQPINVRPNYLHLLSLFFILPFQAMAIMIINFKRVVSAFIDR